MGDLISVIVPIYNVEQYLPKCIDSIISQTYNNIEIILVDDGSTDRSSQICDEYAKNNSKIVAIHKENGGADSARKAAIKIAKGEYIAYVDGDDWIEPQMFERLYCFAKKYNAKIVESGIIDTSSSYCVKRISPFDEGLYVEKAFETIIEPNIIYFPPFFKHGIFASLCNKLYKKNIIEKYQMLPDHSDNIFDDVMVSIPCVAEAKSIYITHECFYHYRVRNDSVKHSYRPNFASRIISCYKEWMDRFQYCKKKSIIQQQLDYYLMYILLSKCPGVFDQKESDKVLIPFGGISKNSKVIVHGAGAAGIQLAKYISEVFDNNFLLWTDKNYNYLCKELNVNDPMKILNLDFDYVIIGILWYDIACSAKSDLIEIGIPEKKILTFSDIYISNPNLLLKSLLL